MKILRSVAISGAALLLLTGAAMAAPTRVALNSLVDPPAKIASARVIDNKGRMVGAVQRIELDANGRASSVEFALLGKDQVIALDSSNFNYDQRKNALVARLSKSRIMRVPSFMSREGLVI